MYLDENFDINSMDKSLFDLIFTKFRMTGKQRSMSDEAIEDMMQEWFLRKCRLGNTSFIKHQPYVEFRKVVYGYSFLSETNDHPIFDELEGNSMRQEEYTELNSVYDLILDKFGQSLCNMFFDSVNGFTNIELATHYGVSDNTVGRRIKKVRKWLNE